MGNGVHVVLGHPDFVQLPQVRPCLVQPRAEAPAKDDEFKITNVLWQQERALFEDLRHMEEEKCENV